MILVTFHLSFAQFFLICSLTVPWMFLFEARPPDILEWGRKCTNFLAGINMQIVQAQHYLKSQQALSLSDTLINNWLNSKTQAPHTQTISTQHWSSVSISPWMSDSLLAGVSLLRVQFHQVANEVLSRVRDLVPVGGVKLVVPSHDLMEQLSIILVIEWRVTTQPGGDVGNEEPSMTHTHSPRAEQPSSS